MAKENEQAGSAPGGKKKTTLLLAVGAVVLLIVGGGVGAVALAPMLRPAASAEPGKEAGEHEDAGKAAPEGEKHGPAVIHTLENLVLNPAQTQGTRFLMVTLALEVKDEGVAAQLVARDAELRDVVLRVLGAHTVEQLADLKTREVLRTVLRDSVRTLVPRGVNRIYFPQFVIQ